MSELASVKVNISGRVQGVFFRMETQRAAKAVGVAGYVKNLADGSVEAVFQGDKALVDRMLEWCEDGSPAARVDRITRQEIPPLTDTRSFDIRW